MVNNSDGLTPTLRPQLGVGWNRALPAPFGFDNGFYPDGVNDHFKVDRLNVTPYNQSICIEFWINNLNTSTGYIFTTYNNSLGKFIGAHLNGTNFTVIAAAQSFSATLPVGKHHVVINFSNAGSSIYIDGAIVNSSTIVNLSDMDLFKNFEIGLRSSVGFYIKSPIDEFRLYNRSLHNSEVLLNYNGGIGDNPCLTDILLLWYKFQSFEMLDFSALQDNTDIKLGIRDNSGKNNHAQPFNMDTNPASPNYVLKPF